MITLLTHAAVAVVFFVFGVLFGRKNRTKVEAAVATAEKALSK